MKHCGDITKLNGADLPPVDVITGGSPCQNLSMAGNRKGLEGAESKLFLEQIRIVREMRNADKHRGRTAFDIRPRFMVWENVPGAFSSNGGKDFQTVLTEIVRIVKPEAPVVPLPEGGKWSRAGALMGIGEGGVPFSIAYRVFNAQFWGTAQRRKRIALIADFGGLSAPEILFERKGVSWDPEQSADKKESSAGYLEGDARGAGGAIGVDVYNQTLTGDIAPTITAATGGVNTSGAKVLSFQERAGKAGGGKGLLIQEDSVAALASYKQVVLTTESQENNVPMVLKTSSVFAVQRIGEYKESEQAASLKARDFKGWSSLVCEKQSRVVRRLTPLECERLQGYPDGWTDIGEWTDSKGKKHKPADSPRYRALGNSIAVGYANRRSGSWMWLMKRISAQYERTATLGSLFDGIGGFPLAWESVNGPGSAIWASEIDEFCIAVTKKHFPDGTERMDYVER